MAPSPPARLWLTLLVGVCAAVLLAVVVLSLGVRFLDDEESACGAPVSHNVDVGSTLSTLVPEEGHFTLDYDGRFWGGSTMMGRGAEVSGTLRLTAPDVLEFWPDGEDRAAAIFRPTQIGCE